MPKRIDVLDRIDVASPCQADWDEMTGDEQVRFCQHCSKHVHDLSQITRNDVRKLVAASGGSLCVRYRKRPDGTLKTIERPEPLTQIKRRLSRIAAGAFTASLSLAQSVAAQTARPAGGERPAAIQPATLGRLLLKPVAGGQTASLVGNVYDPQQAAVSGATVVLVNQATGQEQSVTTGDDGAYQFPELEPGTYALRIGAPGFLTFVQNDIVFAPGVQNRVDASLEIGEITGVVSVIAPSTPLVRAIWEDDMNAVQYLLASGVDVNVVDEGMGMTALGEAVATGKLEFVRALIHAGADPNVRGYGGRTALMRLDEDATAEIVRALLAAGAKVNLRDEEGNTALHAAARVEKSEVARALLDAGARVNGRNKERRTALMIAADAGHLDNVKALLWAGANTNLRDNNGETALRKAAAGGHQEIVALLQAYGADE